MQKVKVVYIMGAGRSGSTILGVLLGNLRNIFYAGELATWHKFRGVPKTENKEVLRFWINFKKKFLDAEKYFKYDYYDHLEHHTSIFYFYKYFDNSFFYNYQDFNSEFLRQLLKTTKSKYIVDSSRLPLRAYWLSKNKHIDLRLIYLIRDSREVVNSFKKKGIEQSAKSPFSANLYLILVSILSSIIYA